MTAAIIMDTARVTSYRTAHRVIAEAVKTGQITLLDVVAVEEKQPKRFAGTSELVAYVLMEE